MDSDQCHSVTSLVKGMRRPAAAVIQKCFTANLPYPFFVYGFTIYDYALHITVRTSVPKQLYNDVDDVVDDRSVGILSSLSTLI